MVERIPSDLLESVKGVLKHNIEDYDIELLTNDKGQGFLGEIIYVNLIHNKTKHKEYLVAKQGRNDTDSPVELLDTLFQNEINFYKKIWPFLQNYYNGASGNDINIVPKCFGASNTGCKRIILENVTSLGYKLYDKTKPFDDNHYTKIFETYGIYHGISMALREQDLVQFNEFVNAEINILKELCNDESKPFIKSLTRIFQETQSFFHAGKENHILEKIRQCEELLPKLMYQYLTEDHPNGVILHGDCWSNNLMFRYDNQNTIQEIKLLDFQMPRHGSPVIDLSNCLYSGATEEILNNLDSYLKIYHNSLSKTLEEFGLSAEKVYSFKTFNEEWKKYCKYGFILAPFLWKIKLVDKDDVPDFTQELNVNIKISGHMQDDLRNRFRELAFHMYNNDFF